MQIHCQEWKKHSRALLQERSIIAINNSATIISMTVQSHLQLVPRRACINAVIRNELDPIEVEVVLPAQNQEKKDLFVKEVIVAEQGILQGVVPMMRIMELRMDTLDPYLLMILVVQEINLDQRVHLPPHLLL
jgi:hypothetical protein